MQKFVPKDISDVAFKNMGKRTWSLGFQDHQKNGKIELLLLLFKLPRKRNGFPVKALINALKAYTVERTGVLNRSLWKVNGVENALAKGGGGSRGVLQLLS